MAFAKDEERSAFERQIRRGTITIGLAIEFPYAYRDSGQEPTGEAPEIAKRVLREIGITDVIAVETEFDRLIPDLLEGKFGMIATGMPICRELHGHILFSEPTHSVGQVILARTSDIKALEEYESELPRNTILGRDYLITREFFVPNSDVPSPPISILDDISSGLRSLRNGNYAAILTDSVTANLVTRESADFQILKRISAYRADGNARRLDKMFHGAFGFRSDETRFRDYFNGSLRNFLRSEEHLELIECFGFTEHELPAANSDELIYLPAMYDSWSFRRRRTKRRYQEIERYGQRSEDEKVPPSSSDGRTPPDPEERDHQREVNRTHDDSKSS